MKRAGDCRFCGAPLGTTFADLGVSPLANSYLKPDRLDRMEPFYPLHAFVCDECLLVQLEEFESPEAIFGDYAYFSSYSDSLLAHAKAYCEAMAKRFGIDASKRVVEIASNDGYLLRNFVEMGVPVLGIEPAANVARTAVEAGIPTRVEFFGEASAKRLRAEGLGADLTAANNVLAHVPALNDFVEGFRVLLNPHGVATFEFPHLMRLVERNQFDTIYHEHFSYFSLLAVERIFASHDLEIFDVDEIPTHGGSLRIYVKHAADDTHAVHPRVAELRRREVEDGFDRVERYTSFGAQVAETKRALLAFLIDAKQRGQSIVSTPRSCSCCRNASTAVVGASRWAAPSWQA